jgi:hypothetical protein
MGRQLRHRDFEVFPGTGDIEKKDLASGAGSSCRNAALSTCISILAQRRRAMMDHVPMR